MVIWLTGLSGSGKSTLAAALCAAMEDREVRLVRLDGDDVRATFGNDLGHTEANRVTHIKRMQRFAKLLDNQNVDVIVSALFSRPDLLEWNRENFSKYFEIYMKADLDFLIQRDTKGLYRKALSGEIKDVVGVDIAWSPPVRPELIVDAATAPSAEVLAKDVMFNLAAAGFVTSGSRKSGK